LLLLIIGSTSAYAQTNPYSEKKNMAAFALTYDWFDQDIEPWQKAYVEYRRYTDRGPVIARLNIGHRFDITDYQGEIDFWPAISENWYGYLNVGYSGADLFPQFRGGAEIYRVLPKGFEASLGFGYLKFSSDHVLIYTGSLSKYLGKWLLIGRPYFTPQDSGISSSITFIARRYFANPESFASFIGGFGFSPDERRLIDGQADQRFLKSRYLGLIGNYLVRDRFELFGELKATDQEFPFSEEFIRIYTFEMGARYRF
jgi:YaiO family outer membrane protein